VYAGSSYGKQAMLAIRLQDATGDITGTDNVVWRLNRYTPYVPSPLLYKNLLYFLRHYQGIMTCLNAKTGEAIYGPTRLPGVNNVYASPVGAAGRVYIAAQNGVTLVLKHGARPIVLATNRIDEGINASPAIAGGEMFLRGEHHLYCIAE
ncbi:hypothetical protein LCGC14_2032910, partial [marine sediment metagenome]